MHLQNVKDVELPSKIHVLYNKQVKYFGLLFMEQNSMSFYILRTVGRQLCAHTTFIISSTLKSYKGIKGISTNFALFILALLVWYSSI